MKTTIFRPRLGRLLPALIIIAALGACATEAEVRAIIGESNQLLLLQESATLAPDLDFAEKSQSAQLSTQRKLIVRRIDDFITKHPKLKAVNNALTIRKALILLVSGERSMARASFAAYDATVPTNTRDLALYKVYGTLVWWSAEADNDLGHMAGHSRYIEAINNLSTAIDGLAQGESARYALAALRALIAQKAAQNMDEMVGATFLIEQLVLYSDGFSQDDRKRVALFQDPEATAEQLKTIPHDRLRWYAQVQPLYEKYQRVMKRVHPTGNLPWPPSTAWMASLGN